MKNYFFHYMFAALILTTSCGEEEEQLPDNVIEDEAGLVIQLEWTTGGSVSNSISDTDLELFLYKGDTKVDGSERSTDYEDVELSGLLADGEYRVQINVFSIEKATDFTLFVIGSESERSVEYTGSFGVDEDDAFFPEFVTIVKAGETYTISK